MRDGGGPPTTRTDFDAEPSAAWSTAPMRTGGARRQKGMSRIAVQTHVTLDGVIESPPEALLPYMSDEGRQATLEPALASDALLLGRVTWQHLALAWREQTGPIAERFNTMPKYVVACSTSPRGCWLSSWP